MFRSEIYRATVVITLFWWTALTIYAISQSGSDWAGAFQSWKYVIFSVITTPLLVFGVVVLVIKNRAFMMEPSSGMNMTCTLGSVPAWLKPPKLGNTSTIPPLPKRILKAIDAAGEKNPVYKDLAIALLRVLAVNAKLPASPYESGHGNETLFSHTIKVTLKTLIKAEDFSYTGLYSTYGTLVVGLRESNYRFDPSDPLILIASLAHDIGKINAYILKGGKVTGIKKNHDTFSMLMLSRMPEFGKLSFKDGRALLGAVGYYHAPQTLPLDSVNRAVDDRTIAILELLRHCDIEASMAEEAGVTERIQRSEIKTSQNKTVSDDDIWNAFMTLIQEPSRVNGTSGKITVGQKWENFVYFNEIKVRREIIKLLGIADPGARGDGTHPLTIRLTTILADKDLLMNKFEGNEYGPTRSFFSVKFYDQNDGHEVGSWPATFIVIPDSNQLPVLSRLKSHKSRAVILKPLMGTHAARNKHVKNAPSDVDVQSNTPATEPVKFIFPTAEPAEETDEVTSKPETGNPFPIIQSVSSDPILSPIVDTVSTQELNADENQISVDESTARSETQIDHDNAGDVILTEEEKLALAADDDAEMYSACDTHAEMAADDKKRHELVDARKHELQSEREKGLPGGQRSALGKMDKAIDSGLAAFKDTETLAAEAIAVVTDMWQKCDAKLQGISVIGPKDPKNLYVRLDGLTRILPDHKWELFVEKKLVNTKDNGQMLILIRLP